MLDETGCTDIGCIRVDNCYFLLMYCPFYYILGHKASLSKYKKIEITPCILSDNNALKLELNNQNNSRKHANNWRLNNILINNQWVIEEIREENKKVPGR
jgi:hypothetical protein